jgi:hypothetical protein
MPTVLFLVKVLSEVIYSSHELLLFANGEYRAYTINTIFRHREAKWKIYDSTGSTFLLIIKQKHAQIIKFEIQ